MMDIDFLLNDPTDHQNRQLRYQPYFHDHLFLFEKRQKLTARLLKIRDFDIRREVMEKVSVGK